MRLSKTTLRAPALALLLWVAVAPAHSAEFDYLPGDLRARVDQLKASMNDPLTARQARPEATVYAKMAQLKRIVVSDLSMVVLEEDERLDDLERLLAEHELYFRGR